MNEAGAKAGLEAPDALTLLFNDENCFVSLPRSTAKAKKPALSAARCAMLSLTGRFTKSILRPRLLPEAIIAQAKAAGLRAIPTGLHMAP